MPLLGVLPAFDVKVVVVHPSITNVSNESVKTAGPPGVTVGGCVILGAGVGDGLGAGVGGAGQPPISC